MARPLGSGRRGCPMSHRKWFVLSAPLMPGCSSPWQSVPLLNPESLAGNGQFYSEHLLPWHLFQIREGSELSKSETMQEASFISPSPMALVGLGIVSDPSLH